MFNFITYILKYKKYLDIVVKIYKKIKQYLSKNKESTKSDKIDNLEEDIDTDYADEYNNLNNSVDKFSKLNLSNVGEVKFFSGSGDKNILLMDDVPDTAILYLIAFKNMKKLYQYDVDTQYKIYGALGPNAGLIAYKYILENKVDVAILDITIGQITRNTDDEIVDIDGIDIAIEIWKYNPNAKILFLTAHTLNKNNSILKEYYDKFEKLTGRKIENHYLNKNDDNRTEIILSHIRFIK